ncbi:glycosyltransferase [Candidatus Saccharibacteria bacterium]|nr:glycosyltransferase [Candidatus Saccharibacteria bacterium]
MIVGQFCDSYPPTLDGVARVTFSYCETLGKMGHAAYYIAPKNPDAPEYPFLNTILSPGVKIPTEQWHVGLPAFGFKYRKNLKEIPFDIVHAQSPFIAGHEALRIAKKLNVPLVSTFHSKYYDDFLQRTHSKKISQLLTNNLIEFYNRCDAVWAVNDGTANVLREYGFGGKITVMENGTDLEEVPPKTLERMKLRIKYSKNIPLLIFVGRHNKQKNIQGVLESCKILKDRNVDFRLVTAGDGPDFDKLVKLCYKLDLDDKVQFLGHIDDRAEIMALYSLADLLVFPSLYDNAPMVLREAAAMGTPGLLVSGSTSAENLVDGKNALIAANDSPEAIAGRIQNGLTILKEVGANAQKTIPVSWDRIMEKVIDEYTALIREKQSRIR